MSSVEDQVRAIIAEQLGISERTVKNDWRMAKAWLRAKLDPRD